MWGTFAVRYPGVFEFAGIYIPLHARTSVEHALKRCRTFDQFVRWEQPVENSRGKNIDDIRVRVRDPRSRLTAERGRFKKVKISSNI